jgi:glycosyltransferase involved in cell wall biosynthesis
VGHRIARLPGVSDIRWFAPNPYTTLVVPELRRRGFSIDLEGQGPARLALAMSGTVAEPAWRYAAARGCPLIMYLWDLPPDRLGGGAPDPVWWVAGRFLHLPRLTGGFASHRRYYSRVRYIAARAVEVWVPSEMTGSSVRERLGLPSRRVPYCYDSSRFAPAPMRRDDPPTLLTVSRLEAHKNQAAALRAAARLGREVQVRFIGRGPESGRLERLASSLSVRCRIDQLATDPEVVEAYHRARVAVCPSRFEGFGLTPIEAIACGTPVVASDIPPHREFCRDAAIYFPPDDEDALAAGIRFALDRAPSDASVIRELTIASAADRFQAVLRPLLG